MTYKMWNFNNFKQYNKINDTCSNDIYKIFFTWHPNFKQRYNMRNRELCKVGMLLVG